MKKAMVFLLICCLLFLYGCAQLPAEDPTQGSTTSTEPSTQATEATKSTEPSTEPTEATRPTEPPAPTEPPLPFTPAGTAVSEAYLQRLQALVDNPASWYTRAMLSEYTSAKDVDLFRLFREGDARFHTLTDAEKMYVYQTEADRYGISVDEVMKLDISRISEDHVEIVLDMYFGLTLEETNQVGLNDLIHNERTDSYYHMHGDTNLFLDGVEIAYAYMLDDGSVDIYYNNTFLGNASELVGGATHVMHLVPTWTGTYRIASNLSIEMATTGRAPMKDYEVDALQEELFPDWYSWYARAATSEYSDPRDVNIAWMFWDGDEESTLAQWEDTYIRQQLAAQKGVGVEEISLDISKISASDLKAVLKKCFGLTLEETNKVGLDGLYYDSGTGCYYKHHGDTFLREIELTEAYRRIDGSIDLYYEYTNKTYVMNVMPNGDGYYIRSNLLAE